MKIRKGLIKRIHVNRHVLAANRRHGRDDPPVTVQTSNGPIRGHSVRIDGPSEVIYNPEKPLSCGAHLWVETKAEVEVTT